MSCSPCNLQHQAQAMCNMEVVVRWNGAIAGPQVGRGSQKEREAGERGEDGEAGEQQLAGRKDTDDKA